MPVLPGSINHLRKEQWLCVKGGQRGGERGGRELWGGCQGQVARVSLSLTLAAPLQLLLTGLHASTHLHKRGRGHTHIQSRCLSHTLAAMRTHARLAKKNKKNKTPTSSGNCSELPVLPRGKHSNYANACQFINLVLTTTRFLDCPGMHISQG